MCLPRHILHMWALVLVILAASPHQITTAEDSTPATTPSASQPAAFNFTALDRLRMNLFTNYDKNAHPMDVSGALTNITLGMTVYYIDIDEYSGKMTLHSWLYISWNDSSRTWKPQEYENIKRINLNPRDMWKPKITLFNSASNDGDYVGDTKIVLTNDGRMLWVPPAIYTAYCNLNLQMWPYDKQTCNVNVGSWSLTAIDPRFDNHSISIEYLEIGQSSEWEVVDSRAVYREKDYYNYVEFTFQLQRLSSMYEAVIFTPAACIILLTLATFWLPPQMGEKILLNGIVIVVIAVFLMYFAQLLPIMSENTPLIVLFYSSSLMMLSLSTIIAVVVLYLATAKHKRRLPQLLNRVLNGPVGNVLLLSHFSLEQQQQVHAQQQESLVHSENKELSENVYDNPDAEIRVVNLTMNGPSVDSDTTPSIQFGWLLLATAVDRLSFVIFSLTFIVLAIVYSV